MENIREFGRINLNLGISNNLFKIDEFESRGARNKFWFNNWNFMYKEIFLESYEDYAELISYEIANVLGIPCANYDLAIFNGQKGIITENFVKEDQGEELISGYEIINEVYQKYILPVRSISERFNNKLKKDNLNLIDKKQLIIETINECKKMNMLLKISEYNADDDVDKIIFKLSEYFNEINIMYDFLIEEGKNDELKLNNLYDLWAILEIYCKIFKYDNPNLLANQMIQDLANLFIYDILTLQGDRHCSNWSVIKNNNTRKIKIAPLYDNSNMCNLNRTKALKSIEEKIINLNSPSVPNIKKERTMKRLLTEMYHSRSLLGINPENNIDKQKNLLIIDQFINISSSEWLNVLIEKMNLLSEDEMSKIYNKIETKIGSEIPGIVKLIVSYSISLNIEQIKKILLEKEEKYNVK